MSSNFRNFLTDDLAQEVERVQAEYDAYLSSLPSHIRQSVIQIAPPDVFISSGACRS